MTTAPEALRAARSLLIAALDTHPGSTAYPADLDPGEVGIVGDTAHAETGTSYHLGADQLRADAYSARTARDRAGLTNDASAVDVGEFSIKTARGTFTHRDLAIWSVAQCRAGHPDTADIREVIYSPDGVRVFCWDRERGRTSAPVERKPDSHRWHNHYSQYRDATKAGRRTLLAHFTRWLTEIGAIDMALRDDPDGRALISRVDAIIDMRDSHPTGDNLKPEANKLALALKALALDVAEIKGRPPVQPAPVDLEALTAALAPALRQIVREEIDATHLAGR